VLFAENCARCHNSYPYTWTEANKYGKRFIEVGLIPEKYVGTDPGQFEDLRPYFDKVTLPATFFRHVGAALRCER
jgi:hypothetical protein